MSTEPQPQRRDRTLTVTLLSLPDAARYVSRLNFFFAESLKWPLGTFMPNPYYWAGACRGAADAQRVTGCPVRRDEVRAWSVAVQATSRICWPHGSSTSPATTTRTTHSTGRARCWTSSTARRPTCVVWSLCPANACLLHAPPSTFTLTRLDCTRSFRRVCRATTTSGPCLRGRCGRTWACTR